MFKIIFSLLLKEASEVKFSKAHNLTEKWADKLNHARKPVDKFYCVISACT